MPQGKWRGLGRALKGLGEGLTGMAGMMYEMKQRDRREAREDEKEETRVAELEARLTREKIRDDENRERYRTGIERENAAIVRGLVSSLRPLINAGMSREDAAGLVGRENLPPDTHAEVSSMVANIYDEHIRTAEAGFLSEQTNLPGSAALQYAESLDPRRVAAGLEELDVRFQPGLPPGQERGPRSELELAAEPTGARGRFVPDIAYETVRAAGLEPPGEREHDVTQPGIMGVSRVPGLGVVPLVQAVEYRIRPEDPELVSKQWGAANRLNLALAGELDIHDQGLSREALKRELDIQADRVATNYRSLVTRRDNQEQQILQATLKITPDAWASAVINYTYGAVPDSFVPGGTGTGVPRPSYAGWIGRGLEGTATVVPGMEDAAALLNAYSEGPKLGLEKTHAEMANVYITAGLTAGGAELIGYLRDTAPQWGEEQITTLVEDLRGISQMAATPENVPPPAQITMEAVNSTRKQFGLDEFTNEQIRNAIQAWSLLSSSRGMYLQLFSVLDDPLSDAFADQGNARWWTDHIIRMGWESLTEAGQMIVLKMVKQKAPWSNGPAGEPLFHLKQEDYDRIAKWNMAQLDQANATFEEQKAYEALAVSKDSVASGVIKHHAENDPFWAAYDGQPGSQLFDPRTTHREALPPGFVMRPPTKQVVRDAQGNFVEIPRLPTPTASPATLRSINPQTGLYDDFANPASGDRDVMDIWALKDDETADRYWYEAVYGKRREAPFPHDLSREGYRIVGMPAAAHGDSHLAQYTSRRILRVNMPPAEDHQFWSGVAHGLTSYRGRMPGRLDPSGAPIMFGDMAGAHNVARYFYADSGMEVPSEDWRSINLEVISGRYDSFMRVEDPVTGKWVVMDPQQIYQLRAMRMAVETVETTARPGFDLGISPGIEGDILPAGATSSMSRARLTNEQNEERMKQWAIDALNNGPLLSLKVDARDIFYPGLLKPTSSPATWEELEAVNLALGRKGYVRGEQRETEIPPGPAEFPPYRQAEIEALAATPHARFRTIDQAAQTLAPVANIVAGTATSGANIMWMSLKDMEGDIAASLRPFLGTPGSTEYEKRADFFLKLKGPGTAAAREFNLNPRPFFAMALGETGFNPDPAEWIGPPVGMGDSSAEGVWQVMPYTARQAIIPKGVKYIDPVDGQEKIGLGLVSGYFMADDPGKSPALGSLAGGGGGRRMVEYDAFNIEHNARVAAAITSSLFNKYRDRGAPAGHGLDDIWRRVMMAYNMGEYRLENYLTGTKTGDPLPYGPTRYAERGVQSIFGKAFVDLSPYGRLRSGGPYEAIVQERREVPGLKKYYEQR